MTYAIATDTDHIATARTADGARTRAKKEARRLGVYVSAYETLPGMDRPTVIASFTPRGVEFFRDDEGRCRAFVGGRWVAVDYSPA